jgi:hypothetical protein
VPAHAKPQRHPTRWAVLAAVAAVATLVVVVRPAMGHSGDPAAAPVPTAATTTPAPVVTTPAPTTPAPTTVTPKPTPRATPTQVAIPQGASGKLAVVPGEVPAAGPGTPLRYTLKIEAGLPLDGAAIATQVHAILTDRRGWQPIEGVAFARTGGAADFELIIASPDLTDRLCYPLDTIGQLSCRNGNKVILNARRWATAVPWYPDMNAYRTYLVNHEVGHRLGHGHKTCPSPGAPAPVMVQQSKSLYGCRANPWPSVSY